MTKKPLLAAFAAAAMMMTAAACTERQERSAERAADSAGRTVDNAATTTAVKTKLAADVRLSTLTSINVDSNGSTVTLTGRVPTDDDKRRAEEVARSVDGVARVVNNLVVQP
ncbi:MAG: BON domain-containing protein [Bryobacteraceae bacterium]|nr:BON domain-containing protein [Bryobacteraceae bacterium]